MRGLSGTVTIGGKSRKNYAESLNFCNFWVVTAADNFSVLILAIQQSEYF